MVKRNSPLALDISAFMESELQRQALAEISSYHVLTWLLEDDDLQERFYRWMIDLGETSDIELPDPLPTEASMIEFMRNAKQVHNENIIGLVSMGVIPPVVRKGDQDDGGMPDLFSDN